MNSLSLDYGPFPPHLLCTACSCTLRFFGLFFACVSYFREHSVSLTHDDFADLSDQVGDVHGHLVNLCRIVH